MTNIILDYKNKKSKLYLDDIQSNNFFLPSVWVGVGETIGEEEVEGWQPISAISPQQSFTLWQFWSQ